MRRRLAALLVLGAAGLGWVEPAGAWNNFGHMLVAASAYDQLTPGAKTKVDALLKLNPEYANWVARIAMRDRGKIAFMMAARWPDWIKTQKTYTSDGPDRGNSPPDDPTADQNIGYSDKLMHKYWHFIDRPYKADATNARSAPQVNARTEITLLRKALKSSATSDVVKSYDLVWLEHLVGDVHQPLHCTSRFDTDDPNGDAGGISVRITGAGKVDDLHALWDDFPGTGDAPADAIAKQGSLPKADATKAMISAEATWIDESYKEAKKSVYAPPIGLGNGPFAVDALYTAHGQEVADARLALAGARLAALLNRSFIAIGGVTNGESAGDQTDLPPRSRTTPQPSGGATPAGSPDADKSAPATETAVAENSGSPLGQNDLTQGLPSPSASLKDVDPDTNREGASARGGDDSNPPDQSRPVQTVRPERPRQLQPNQQPEGGWLKVDVRHVDADAHERSGLFPSIPRFVPSIGFALGLLVCLVLAILIPDPSPYQQVVLRTILALCGGGLGVVLPGDLQVGGAIGKLRIEAAGGLGLCVIFYLLTPKILESAETSKRMKTRRKRR